MCPQAMESAREPLRPLGSSLPLPEIPQMFHTQPSLRAPLAPFFRLAALLGPRVTQQTRIEALRPINHARLLDALAASGITHLTVVFTGTGPAARIDSIAPWRGPVAVDLPKVRLRYGALTWDAPAVEWRDLTLTEVVEQIALDFLGDPDLNAACPGGADGQFCFDVRARSICLEINPVALIGAPANCGD